MKKITIMKITMMKKYISLCSRWNFLNLTNSFKKRSVRIVMMINAHDDNHNHSQNRHSIPWPIMIVIIKMFSSLTMQRVDPITNGGCLQSQTPTWLGPSWSLWWPSWMIKIKIIIIIMTMINSWSSIAMMMIIVLMMTNTHDHWSLWWYVVLTYDKIHDHDQYSWW